MAFITSDYKSIDSEQTLINSGENSTNDKQYQT